MFAARNMIFAGVAASVAYRTAVLADSPTAYYRLGEASGTTATDEQGAHNATYVGGPTLGVSGAVAGNNAITTSSGRYAHRTASVLSGALPFTLEGWVKTSSTANQNILVIGNSGGTKSAGISIDTSGNATIYSNGNGGTYYTKAGSFVRDNAWHHIVGVVTTAGLEIFVDGASGGTLSQVIATASDYNRLVAGAFTNYSGPVIGSIDECAVYPTALSASRILAHYNSRNIA